MEAEARASLVAPAPVETVYWHLAAMDLYPAWVTDLRRVRRVGTRQREWHLRGPRGPIRWAVEVTVDQHPHRFGFCVEGPGLVGYTMVRLYPDAFTTGMSVEQRLAINGPMRKDLATWWGDPATRLRRDMWRFKQGLGRPSMVVDDGSMVRRPEAGDADRRLAEPHDAPGTPLTRADGFTIEKVADGFAAEPARDRFTAERVADGFAAERARDRFTAERSQTASR